jgi:peptide/nickel transport system substrate-binding protein
MFKNMNMFTTGVSLLLCVAVASVLSCSEKGSRMARGGILVVGEISDFEDLNPMATTDAHARDVYNLLFLSLLDEQADFRTFEPRLASSYEFNDDRKRLTFHLRRDVYWSDGVQVTARDVEATFHAQTDPAVIWASRRLKEHIDSVEVIDDYTVVYHFNEVYPYQLMDANDGAILPAHILEAVPPEQIPSIPISEIPTNGPFRLELWLRGQSLTIVPYDRYYEEGKPYLDKVVFKVIPDQVTLLTQLKSGEINCMESVPPGEVKDLGERYPHLRVFDFPTRAYNYIGWNEARPPFDNRSVRRAMTLAIDRKRIIENLCYGFAEECKSPFVPLIWAYNPNIEPLPYDPERARKLLADEGFIDRDGDGWLDRGGKRFEFDLLTNYGNQIRVDTQIMVQEMLRGIGVKVNPIALEWTVMLDRVKSSDFDAMVNSWRSGTKADLAPIWSCEARGQGGFNTIGYCNLKLDSLNAAAVKILDFDEAKPLFHRAQEMIYDDQPYTFLYVQHALIALDRRFKGAEPDAIGMYHNLHEWYVSEH